MFLHEVNIRGYTFLMKQHQAVRHGAKVKGSQLCGYRKPVELLWNNGGWGVDSTVRKVARRNLLLVFLVSHWLKSSNSAHIRCGNVS